MDSVTNEKSSPANGSTWKWLRLVVVVIVTAALAVGTLYLTIQSTENFDSVIRGVLSVYSAVATNISETGDILPTGGTLAISIALLSGMLAAINPCGFAILPAYLSLYLSDGQVVAKQQKPPKQVARALVISLTMGVGFVVLFGSIGMLVALLSTSRTFISDAFPWIGLVLGVAMIGLGIFTLLGGKFYSSAPQRYASKIGNPQQIGLRGYFLFGVSYALASLSCTLPLFVAIMAQALANNGFVGVMITFLIYAGGMTLVITIFTILVAFFKVAATRVIFKVLPAVNAISAVLIVIVGVYLLLYWLVEGELVTVFQDLI